MDVTVGQQLVLNDKLATVLAVSDFDGCEVVVCLWLGTGALPHVNGQPRPGSWSKKVVTLLHFPDGSWHRDFDCPARVRANDDPTRQINVAAWMAAFARTIHPAPVAT